jgi:hypothetical protein
LHIINDSNNIEEFEERNGESSEESSIEKSSKENSIEKSEENKGILNNLKY